MTDIPDVEDLIKFCNKRIALVATPDNDFGKDSQKGFQGTNKQPSFLHILWFLNVKSAGKGDINSTLVQTSRHGCSNLDFLCQLQQTLLQLLGNWSCHQAVSKQTLLSWMQNCFIIHFCTRQFNHLVHLNRATAATLLPQQQQSQWQHKLWTKPSWSGPTFIRREVLRSGQWLIQVLLFLSSLTGLPIHLGWKRFHSPPLSLVETSHMQHPAYSVATAVSEYDGSTLTFSPVLVNTITSNTPVKYIVNSQDTAFTKNLNLADPAFVSSGQIDLLLGQDVLAQVLRPGFVSPPSSTLYGLNTMFG